MLAGIKAPGRVRNQLPERKKHVANERLRIMTEDQVAQIDAAVVHILSEIGLRVASSKVNEILSRAGCIVHNGNTRVPETLLRQAIENAPRSFELCGREPEKTITIGDGQTHIQPMIGRLHILDFDGTRRLTTLEDVQSIVRICDALDHYDILHGGAVMPSIDGVARQVTHVAGFVQTLRCTGKPFKGTCRDPKVAEDCLRLAEAAASATGAPFMLHTTCNLISPLQIAEEISEGALSYIRKGWPVDFAAEPQMGATSPVTLSGTVAQSLAESLTGLVLAQAVNPSAPVFLGSVAAAMDMRHATIALGGVEAALVNAAHAQMCAHWGIPSRGTGSNTNAKQLDFQAGFEKMLTLLLPALAGTDMIFYPGTIEHAETISLESLVLDHDLCAIAQRAREGLRVSDDLLAVDLIKQVGPGGMFLALPQTAREMFTEHLVHGLWDRRLRSDWEAAGAPTPATLAHEKAEQILARPQPALSEAVEDAVRNVVEEIAQREDQSDLVKELWP